MFSFEVYKNTFLFGKKLKSTQIIKPHEFEDLEGPINFENFSKYAVKRTVDILNREFGYHFPDLYKFKLAWIDINDGTSRMLAFKSKKGLITEVFIIICSEY